MPDWLVPNLFDIGGLIVAQLSWALIGLVLLIAILGIESLWRGLRR